MRSLVIWAIGVCIFGALLIAAVLGGYYIHAWQVTPVADLLPRIERKIDDIRGEPSDLERRVALLETTFVQLRGTVMRPPGAAWESGGALAVRDDQLIIMDRRGRFWITDGESPIRRLDGLVAPENGLADLEAFIETPAAETYTLNATRLRFNDVHWVDTEAGAGLALSYSFFDPERLCYGTRLAWVDIARDAPLEAAADDWRILFEGTPCMPLMDMGASAMESHMAGGRMAFEAPSTIYLANGDYHLDGIATPDVGIQSDDSSYGKVLAIDLVTGDQRIVSRGHRNPQGIALTGDGRLFVAEHGYRGGDELNLIRDGGNYGWPETSLGTLYSGQPLPDMTYGRHDVGTPPVYAWLPSAAVSSLMVIDGIDPAWDGDLLVGSLSSAEFGQSLWHIRVTGERADFVERIRLGTRVRYLTQFGEKIAVWLDTNDLVLFDVTRRADPLKSARAFLAATYDAETAEAISSVLDGCNECHSFAEDENLTGPSLNGVVGRAVAGTGFRNYSDALKGLGGNWSPERLAAYLADPQAVAPGTYMPASGLQEGALMDALIETLAVTDSAGAPHLTYN